MPVSDALQILENIPQVKQKLQTLVDVGLGYIHLGQSAVTLSGGEAQRIKLARELSKRQTGKTLYLLDEPTTGLHFDDVRKLLDVLHRLTDLGNTVIIIEHNLDVIRNADWIVDLGPEGGEEGGRIVAQGTPEQVARVKKSYTGQALSAYFNGSEKKLVREKRIGQECLGKKRACRHRGARVNSSPGNLPKSPPPNREPADVRACVGRGTLARPSRAKLGRLHGPYRLNRSQSRPRSRSPDFIPAAPPDPAWNGWDVLRLMVLTIVALFVGVFAVLFVARIWLYPHSRSRRYCAHPPSPGRRTIRSLPSRSRLHVHSCNARAPPSRFSRGHPLELAF